MRRNPKFLLKLVALTLMLSGSACSYSVHQVYISSMDQDARNDKGQWVEADAQDYVILFFAAQTDYVNKAYHELENKCTGRLAQVSTEHLTKFWFLSYTQKVVLRGLCKA